MVQTQPHAGAGPSTYLPQQHHVLHDEGDVEERGEAVEEVKLRGDGLRRVPENRGCHTTMPLPSAATTHHQHFQDQVVLIRGLQSVVFCRESVNKRVEAGRYQTEQRLASHPTPSGTLQRICRPGSSSR